jgi:hypothetical protein
VLRGNENRPAVNRAACLLLCICQAQNGKKPVHKKVLALGVAVFGASMLGLLLGTAGVPVWLFTLIAFVVGVGLYLVLE